MSWRRSPLGALALVVPLLAAVSPAAWANHGPGHSCDGSAETRRGGGEAGGACEGATGSGSGGGDAEVACDPTNAEIAYYDPDPPEERWLFYTRVAIRDPAPEGMAWMAGYNCAGRYVGGPYLVDDPEWADIRSARDVARARVQPPLPAPNVSPSEAVVRNPTWLWVEEGQWQPASASASQGAVTVRVEARPVKVTWDLQDGVRVCEGPGIPWSEEAQSDYEAQPESTRGRGNPACTFTFTNSSSTTDDGVYHATVTVTWEFSWWLNGTARGVFGAVERSSDFDLRVGEVEALITDR